jgi:hypothetical protein
MAGSLLILERLLITKNPLENMNTNTPPSSSEGLSETKKVPPQASVKDQLKGIAIAIFLGVGIAVIAFQSGGTSNTSQPTTPEVPAPQDNSSKHYSYVLEYIKAKATHPSTVDFCSVLNLQKKIEKQPNGSTLYAYRNCMTAKNSFGAELKYDWVVVLEESTNGSIKVTNSDIKEE